MCYSAQVWAEYRKYERTFGAGLSIQQYVRFFWERRRDGTWRKIAKGVKDAFANPGTDGEREIAAIIAEGDAELTRTLEAELFGYRHGVMVVNAFYESVPRHKAEHRELAPGEKEENLVLEFRPNPAHDMLVACLWSYHEGNDKSEGELFSFAAITDEPPAEVAAAGHDRCIIPVKPENVNAWLNPDPGNLAALQAILDDRDQPFYEHRLAA